MLQHIIIRFIYVLKIWNSVDSSKNCIYLNLIFWVQASTINVTASLLNVGTAYITAQSRNSDNETNGFVFKYCTITGTGPAFLGRAHGNHSRVVFYGSVFDGIITPKGWNAWHSVGKE